ncbi:MAG: DUF2264 domain-containing protein, partial [Candidatus Glassbacteria bacterium]|nr:DUF2264 domain-containing protein [Candidatus Glassbacteria bacterium]
MKPAGQLRVLTAVLCLLMFLASPAGAYLKAGREILDRRLRSPEDRELSPFTGWTREHWVEVAGKMAVGFVQHLDPETGMPTGIYTELPDPPHQRTRQGYDRNEEMRKAFCRGMMIVAAYTAGSGRSTYPGYPQDLVQPFLETLVKATDPDHPEYWSGMPSHSTLGHTIVISMLTSPEFFWDPLTREQKLNLARWLKLLTGRQAWDNNHWYFHMVPAPFLDETEAEYDRALLDRYYQRILGFYRGDGWYVDGDNQGFDYYNCWGFHLFNMILYYSDSRWRDKYGERTAGHAGLFLKNWPYFFGADGAPVAWGRSLHYRFANLSALGWAQRAGVNPLESGLSRRLASGVLKYFWDNGCMSDNGLIEPGYLGRNFAQPEPYGWRGQAIWSAVGLVFLALPPDDPFWTAREKPLPVETVSETRVIPGAQMVVRVDAATGESRLYKVGDPFDHRGRYQRGAKYFGHAYSSKLGFILTGEGSPERVAGRSAASADGKNWCYRENPRPLKISDFENVSAYSLDQSITGAAGEVITHTFIGDHGEVHVIYHTAEKPLFLSVGGYGIRVADSEKAAHSSTETLITVSAGDRRSLIKVLGGVEGSLEMRSVAPRPGFEH